MSHARTQIEVQDPHLKFAQYVDRILVGGDSIDAKAIKIKSAAALYVGECQAREMRAYEAARTEAADSGAMPRFVERDNPLLPPPPLAVVAPSEPTTEFKPMQPAVVTTPLQHAGHSHEDGQPSPDAGSATKQPEAATPTPTPTQPLPKAKDAK